MQSTESKFPPRTFRFTFIAVVCSLLLTYLTITPPLIATDWARLDAAGVYVPVRVDYAWPNYGAQIGLWIVMVGALGAVSRTYGIPFGHQRSAKEEKCIPEEQRYRDTEGEKRTPYHIWVLTAVILVGFGLRVHGLHELPLIIDEIGFAAHASDILHGQQVPIFAPGHNANPSVYSWLIAGIMAVLGQNTFAMRLLPLVFGTLSIPAIYMLGREWWSRRVGLLAAIFLATYPAHIFYSRMSLYNIVDPFFAMLALAFLARGVRFPAQRQYWILAGLMAGMAQYFYHGSRLLLVLIAVYGAWTIIKRGEKRIPEIQRYRDTERNYQILSCSVPLNLWDTFFWFCFSFAVVALPRFASMLVNHLPVTGNEQALHLPADLAANSVRAVLAWVGQKDVSPFWLSDAPLLEWPALLAFGLGILISVWRWRDPRSAVLIASILLTTILGGAIWTAAPLYIRYMTAAPTIGLLVAIGLSAFSGQRSAKYKNKIFTTEAQRKQRKKIRYILLAQMAAITLIAAQGVYAVTRQLEEALGRITASQWIEQDLAQQAAALPSGTAAALIVPDDFNEVQRITIAHSIAAFGERRAVVINQGDETVLDEPFTRLNGLFYVVLKPR